MQAAGCLMQIKTMEIFNEPGDGHKFITKWLFSTLTGGTLTNVGSTYNMQSLYTLNSVISTSIMSHTL